VSEIPGSGLTGAICGRDRSSQEGSCWRGSTDIVDIFDIGLTPAFAGAAASQRRRRSATCGLGEILWCCCRTRIPAAPCYVSQLLLMPDWAKPRWSCRDANAATAGIRAANDALPLLVSNSPRLARLDMSRLQSCFWPWPLI
jgi:hypothetical protein